MPREEIPAPRNPDRLPKLCGADIELGNFILGRGRPGGSVREASQALLREIDAPYARTEAARAGTAYNPQDWGRKYLSSNGSCAYIDLDHLELALPEVLSAYDHVAAWHAMLRVTQRALAAANAKLPSDQTLYALANNSDGRDHAYGSHLNFLVTRRAWDDIFERRMHHLLVLAAFQVSSIVMTGAGKVGAENGRPDVAYQLSQRADFFETVVGPETTHHRPIVNSRDEPLCGPWTAALTPETPSASMARLHCIFFDSTLCHGSSLLRVGPMQLLLGLLEADLVNPELILDDPVAAVVTWSHDPTLAARVRMASGARLTAVELQLRFLEDAQRFAATGGFNGLVPHADKILALWEDTLARLHAGDVAGLASRLDWALKLHILERALASRPGLTWTDTAIKHLDHLYASVDPETGLYWAYERAGAVERLVSDAEIEKLVHEPPEDTRAWGRANLLRIGAGQVQDVDWDRIRFRQGGGYWPTLRTIALDDPLGFTRAAIEPVIEAAGSLDDVLDALGATTATAGTAPGALAWPQLAPPANGGPYPPRRDDDEYA